MTRRVRDTLRFYIGIPATVIYIIAFGLLWLPVSASLFGSIEWIRANASPPQWLNDIVLGIAANVLSALIIGYVIYRLIRNRRLAAVCGRFNAFEVEGTTETEWGTVTIAYELLPTSLFEPQIRCQLERGDTILLGHATIVNNQFLLGHYQETGNLARRRAGSFLFELDGTGDKYEGQFLHISPTEKEPKIGKAIWRRKA